MIRAYLCGPMTGLPKKNYPAFHAEADRLRALGYEIISPAEIWEFDAVGNWHDFMKEDIRAMLTCPIVLTLPGWENSKGAQLEVGIAKALGIHVDAASSVVGLPLSLPR